MVSALHINDSFTDVRNPFGLRTVSSDFYTFSWTQQRKELKNKQVNAAKTSLKGIGLVSLSKYTSRPYS